jgi:hypothetical protein
MAWFQWMAWILLVTFYITCLFTVCGMTFAKGRTALGIIGIFLPFLWLIGAILPAKPGSRYDIANRTAAQQQIQGYSQ